ncbi:MAG: 30S ribosomal protein S20 [candidate division NC10 bacterium]|nr:30S ribosomal protein S20 [candidate division NC10 bacterium]
MPITRSAMKRLRQNQARNLRNRAEKTHLRTTIKKVRAAMEGQGDQSQIQSGLAHAVSVIDKAASKGIIPKNTASRYKSRLFRRANTLKQSS